MKTQNCFITDVYASEITPNKIIEWHDRLNPFFGEISITAPSVLPLKDTNVVIDSEHKNREFVKNILSQLVDMAEFVGEKK